MDATVRTLSPSGATKPASNEAGLESLMREFFSKRPSVGGSESAAEAPVAVQSAAPRRDVDTATELLDRASQAFDLLINRCQFLEHNLQDANERAAGRAAEQDEAIEQWKRLVSVLKAQVDISEQVTAALKARCDMAEARAAEAEKQAVALERASAQAAAHAATADQLSTKLHDKVVAAFGIGSRAHPVLEAMATRAAAG